VRLGLQRTGGIITVCGIVMAGTFATLMISGLGTLVQIGFALAAGVLLETLVVRPFLAPAFLVLMNRLREDPAPATLPFPTANPAAVRRAA
jgi:RND superfamily putative drug exporter